MLTLLGYFFVYSIWTADGLPAQLNVEVGKEGQIETEVECQRVQAYTKQVAEATYPANWRKDFSRPCEATKPQGRKPR